MLQNSDVSAQSVSNHLANQRKPAPDVYTDNQRLTPMEEKVLTNHALEVYKSGFAMTLKNLRDFANELLRMKGDSQPVEVNLQLKFFQQHPEIKLVISRPISKQRVRTES